MISLDNRMTMFLPRDDKKTTRSRQTFPAWLCLGALILACIKSSTPSQAEEVSAGTTIVAVRYRGGVVVGADTRSSASGYVSNRYAAKLTFVLDRNEDRFSVPLTRNYKKLWRSKAESTSDHQDSTPFTSIQTRSTRLPNVEASTCMICRSGSAADTQYLASVIRSEIVSRQLLNRITGTVSNVAALVRNLLANGSSTSVNLICAGYDHELRRGVIFSVAPGGTVFEETFWAIGGSGSTYILGLLDSCYPEFSSDTNTRELSSEKEALEFASTAIRLAMDRDGSSGGFIRLYVIDRFGKRFVPIVPSLSTSNSDDSKRSIAPFSVNETHNVNENAVSSSQTSSFAPAVGIKSANIIHANSIQ